MTVFKSVISLCVFLICSVRALAVDLSEFPDVVLVESYASLNATNPSQRGMGFVFEDDGFILSTYSSVVDQQKSNLLPVINVTLTKNQKKYRAEVVGVEPTINLSILKIFEVAPVRAAKLGTLDSIKVGEEIWAATTSTRNGKADLLMGRLTAFNTRECYQESMTSTMLRAEISVSDNEIGSPILNKSGEVIAMYTGYQAPVKENVIDTDDDTHILPIQLAINIYDSIKFKKNMKSPWTGFSVLALNDSQKKYFPTEHGDEGGIAIESVWENSPAAKLGVQPGDILLRFGHYRIRSPAEFQKWLYMYGVGHTVKLVFLRDGEYQIKEYTIEERPSWAVPK